MSTSRWETCWSNQRWSLFSWQRNWWWIGQDHWPTWRKDWSHSKWIWDHQRIRYFVEIRSNKSRRKYSENFQGKMPCSEKSLIENYDTFRSTWLQRPLKFVWIYSGHLQESACLRGRAQNWPTRLSSKGIIGNQRHAKSISTGVDYRCPQKIQT